MKKNEPNMDIVGAVQESMLRSVFEYIVAGDREGLVLPFNTRIEEAEGVGPGLDEDDFFFLLGLYEGDGDQLIRDNLMIEYAVSGDPVEGNPKKPDQSGSASAEAPATTKATREAVDPEKLMQDLDNVKSVPPAALEAATKAIAQLKDMGFGEITVPKFRSISSKDPAAVTTDINNLLNQFGTNKRHFLTTMMDKAVKAGVPDDELQKLAGIVQKEQVELSRLSNKERKYLMKVFRLGRQLELAKTGQEIADLKQQIVIERKKRKAERELDYANFEAARQRLMRQIKLKHPFFHGNAVKNVFNVIKGFIFGWETDQDEVLGAELEAAQKRRVPGLIHYITGMRPLPGEKMQGTAARPWFRRGTDTGTITLPSGEKAKFKYQPAGGLIGLAREHKGKAGAIIGATATAALGPAAFIPGLSMFGKMLPGAAVGAMIGQAQNIKKAARELAYGNKGGAPTAAQAFFSPENVKYGLMGTGTDAQTGEVVGQGILNRFMKDIKYYDTEMWKLKKNLEKMKHQTSGTLNPGTAAEIDAQVLKLKNARDYLAKNRKMFIKYSQQARKLNKKMAQGKLTTAELMGGAATSAVGTVVDKVRSVSSSLGASPAMKVMAPLVAVLGTAMVAAGVVWFKARHSRALLTQATNRVLGEATKHGIALTPAEIRDVLKGVLRNPVKISQIAAAIEQAKKGVEIDRAATLLSDIVLSDMGISGLPLGNIPDQSMNPTREGSRSGQHTQVQRPSTISVPTALEPFSI